MPSEPPLVRRTPDRRLGSWPHAPAIPPPPTSWSWWASASPRSRPMWAARWIHRGEEPV